MISNFNSSVNYNGGGAVDGLRTIAPYTLSVGNNGLLQLRKAGELIQEQDEEGAWIKSSVGTGTGSLHLGDLHSNGSGGENVVWLNTDSNIAWYPAWAGLSADGLSTLHMSAREHSELVVAEPVGDALTTGTVNYSTMITSPVDLAFFYLESVAAETYSGRLLWTAIKSTGKEVAAFYFDAELIEGQMFTIPFRYPLWAAAGQAFSVSMTKDDGSLVKVRGGSLTASEPYRKTYSRRYYDFNVLHAGKVGWADYADSATPLAMTGDVWKDMPNNGLGVNTNTDFLPFGVEALVNIPSGSIKLSELDIGDEIVVRHTFEVVPNNNGMYVAMRHKLGAAGQEYYLYSGFPQKLEMGGGTPTGDLVVTERIYIGNAATRDNGVVFQIKTSGTATVDYKGAYVSVIKRGT